VHLEASTKPPIHNLIHEFLINMVFTMACPNFKKCLKIAFGTLGVNRAPVENLDTGEIVNLSTSNELETMMLEIIFS
jgi:hypothetical protein